MTAAADPLLLNNTFPMSHSVLGTMAFGDTVSAVTAPEMVAAALDAGVTGVDTANGYAGGESERILGEMMPTIRDRVILATKAGIPHPDAGEAAPLSREGIGRCLEGSLKRLKTDSVDLFYLHQPDRRTPLEETLSAIAELQLEGRIRAYGVSNFAAWQLVDLCRLADAMGVARPAMAQQLFNLVARRLEDEYFEAAALFEIPTMVYNPLGGGLLTGTHHFADRPSDGRFGSSRLASMYGERYWSEGIFDAIGQLRAAAEREGTTLQEFSLRWLRHHDGVDAVLVGGSRIEHIASNLAALQAPPLSASGIAVCEDVGAQLRGPMPTYNR